MRIVEIVKSQVPRGSGETSISSRKKVKRNDSEGKTFTAPQDPRGVRQSSYCTSTFEVNFNETMASGKESRVSAAGTSHKRRTGCICDRPGDRHRELCPLRRSCHPEVLCE